jgi:tetratricopeptide (TPR) repeat protein
MKAGTPSPELTGPLQVLDALVGEPGRAEEARVADACRGIAHWAGTQGMPATELDFAEAAAAVRPLDPELAARAGRVARGQADYERAVQWFRRSRSIARRVGDRRAYTIAYIGWGWLEEQRGRRGQARRLLLQAWRAAKRHKQRDLGAAARHTLLALCCVPDGSFAEGQEHAEAALRLYERDDAMLHRLASDVACLWGYAGYYSAALPVYEAALPHFRRPADRMQVEANLGQAAAVVGEAGRYLDALDEVESLSRTTEEFLARSLVALAEGAWTLGYAAKARELASKAATVAHRRGEAPAEALARTVLDAVDARRPPAADQVPPASIADFAQTLVARLARRGPPGTTPEEPSLSQ